MSQKDEDSNHVLPDGKPLKLALVVRRPLAALADEVSRSRCSQSLAAGSSALIAVAVGLLSPSVMHAIELLKENCRPSTVTEAQVAEEVE